MKSTNTFSLSGRLTADARYFDSKNGKVTRFTLAHNFGQGMPALFTDVVMFSKNGSKEIAIPEDVLKKGNPVLASGYFRPSTSTKDGKTYHNVDLVVTSLSPLAGDAESAE